jgi:tetratricopeptide (TPR) repeat protein
MDALTKGEAKRWCQAQGASFSEQGFPAPKSRAAEFRIPPDAGQRVAVNLGGVLLYTGKHEEALKFNKYAVETRPRDALANSQLGMTYFLLNQDDEALEYLNAARSSIPALRPQPDGRDYIRRRDRVPPSRSRNSSPAPGRRSAGARLSGSLDESAAAGHSGRAPSPAPDQVPAARTFDLSGANSLAQDVRNRSEGAIGIEIGSSWCGWKRILLAVATSIIA